jgi:hypothetical protein
MSRFAPDPCEWNPAAELPRREGDARHGDATVSLGDGEWHLCAACAALPRFARFTARRPITRPEGTV